MHVLDLGCGVGDVSLLAARMVGPTGAVLGVDRAASSVQTARSRAAAIGFANVRFEEAELEAFETDQTFAEVLRRLRRRRRPGGIVAFQEIDMSQLSRCQRRSCLIVLAGESGVRSTRAEPN
jgi:predicted RNA methylase